MGPHPSTAMLTLDAICNMLYGIYYVYLIFMETVLSLIMFVRIYPFRFQHLDTNHLFYFQHLDTIHPFIIEYTLVPEETYALIKMEQMIAHQSFVYADYNHEDEEPLECTICLDEIKEDALVIPLCCGHLFHEDCLHQYFAHNYSVCPICKTQVLFRA